MTKTCCEKILMEHKTSELKSTHHLFFFLLIIIQYSVLFSATSEASIKDIKATGYIFIISNHIVFHSSLFMRQQLKMKISSHHWSSALLFIRERKSLRRQEGGKKSESKNRKQIVSLPSLALP